MVVTLGSGAGQLARIGVFDDAKGRNLVVQHLTGVLHDDTNILRKYSTEHGEFEIRESVLAGPRGVIKQKTTWQVTDDGYRLTTIIPIGGE